MANSFLDKTGLTYLWGKIVALVNRKQDALTFDSTPTDNSTNPVTSGGVKAYVDANAGGSGDSPVESGSGTGSVQTKEFTIYQTTYEQTASGDGSHAEGQSTIAEGGASHAEGDSTKAIGACSHAEGYSTQAFGIYSHSEGANNSSPISIVVSTTSNRSTFVQYTGTLTSGQHGNLLYIPGRSIAKHIVSVNYSTRVITVDSQIVPRLTSESAEIIWGGGSFGAQSHSEGADTIAYGQNSHAEGDHTYASGDNQHVEGKYNVISSSFAHITGIGTSHSNRRNGFTVDWQGNGVFNGKVTANLNSGAITNAHDLTTKGYVDSAAGSKILLEDTNENYSVNIDGSTWNGNILVLLDTENYSLTPLQIWDFNEIRKDMGEYVFEYYPAGDYTQDTELEDSVDIPLTEIRHFYHSNGGEYTKLTFGDNRKTYIGTTSGYFVPESDYVFPTEMSGGG